MGLRIAARAATTERLVVNRYSGLAIDGFDPVAYFTDARPVVGQPGFEVSEAGAVWRFRNEGNRAFFIAHPEIYGPQFGGYDPVDVARGIAFAGNPQFWLVSGSGCICSAVSKAATRLPPIPPVSCARQASAGRA